MLSCQKHRFSLREGEHYLNCSYKAPLLKSSEQAAIEALERMRNPMDITSRDFFTVQQEVRSLFGKIINAPAGRIALIPAVSYGFASVFNNIQSTTKGGNAVTLTNEFPSGYFAIKKWCDQNDVQLNAVGPDDGCLKQGESWNRNILDAINEQTEVVLMSSVHWMSGLKYDLKAIGEKCKTVGATFLVDGSQSVGALPIDIEEYNIDALICAGYKWLFGPYSLALCYMGPKFDSGIPIEESWLNRKNAEDFSALCDYNEDYMSEAGRYNVGQTTNFILMPMLREGLRQLNEWTIEGMNEYCHEITKPVREFSAERGLVIESAEHYSPHLFDMRLPSQVDTRALLAVLKENHVSVSTRGMSIRQAFNVFNDEDDVQALLNVVGQFV